MPVVGPGVIFLMIHSVLGGIHLVVHHLDACLVLVCGKGEEGRGEREGEIHMIKGIQNNVIYRSNIFVHNNSPPPLPRSSGRIRP